MSKEVRDEVVLKVAEAYYRDVGRGIARVDPEIMENYNLQSGDVIEIVGKTSSIPAIVWPGYPDDRGKRTIRIDGSLRSNLGVSIDDKVRVRKVAAKPAEKITIAPTEPIRLVGGEGYLLRLLEGRPVTKGQKIRIEVFGNVLTFVITATKPAGVVIVGRETEVELKEKPEEEIKRTVPNVSYEDIGGLKRELKLVREMIELPLKHPELFERLGIEPPKGVLLYGPPGTGKTLIAKAVANEVNAHFIPISGPEIMSKFYGESEQRLREIFEEAKENAPSIIFIDEIDSIAPKREEVTGEVERRVVAQLLTLMDGLEERGQVIVIGATNRIDAVDPALRRPGRFDREIEIGVPDREGRFEIFQIHTRNMPLEPKYSREFVLDALEQMMKNVEEPTILDNLKFVYGEVKSAEKEEEVRAIINNLMRPEMIPELESFIVKAMLRHLADQTHGFVGADIEALCKEAAMKALRRYLPQIDLTADEIPLDVIESMKVTWEDFMDALKEIEPSAMREVLVEVPKVRWSDIGGLEDVKREVIEAVEWPLKYPEKFKKFGIRPPKGILLFGPPGTGKTLIAKAVANETNANFISVKGGELLSKWLGESEKAVRKIFRKARQVAPCIIFFDEIDAIAQFRGLEEGSRAVERVLNQLLTEMDGLEELQGVIVIGATNRPDILDPALLRPGRFDRLVYVRPPDKKSRLAIFKIHTRNMPLSEDVDLEELSEMTEGYVGADIEAICREAVMLAMRENLNVEKVEMRHFLEAMKKVKPSVSESMLSFYERFEEKLRSEKAKIAAKPFAGYG
ncbi:MAG: CDC48 family AAA ATPase [Archaeoglobaceae archaeon]